MKLNILAMENKFTFLIQSYALVTAIWILNTFYKILKAFSIELIPLTFEKVIKPLTAEERQEASRPDYSIPLEKYLAGFNDNCQSTGLQRLIALQNARRFVKSRASVRNEIRRNPDILQTPVDGPLVITGLPRTGTTMLQRLLENDSQFISPMMWEMMDAPVPAGRPDNWRHCDRYKVTEQLFRDRDLMGFSDLAHKHRLGADLNEECVVILQHYFLGFGDDIPIRCMEDWRYDCPKEHTENAYEFYKVWLQCVFYKRLIGGKRLALKSPYHTLYLDTYKKVLPNAKFVFTYRNLGQVVASFCSLIYEFRVECGYKDDPKEYGKDMLTYFKISSKRTVRFLQQFPKECYIVLGYSELVKDPLSAVKKIYSHFGLKLSQEAEDAMKIHIRENPKDKYGKHHYSLDDYGITEADLRETFSEFIDYFKDGTEKLL